MSKTTLLQVRFVSPTPSAEGPANGFCEALENKQTATDSGGSSMNLPSSWLAASSIQSRPQKPAEETDFRNYSPEIKRREVWKVAQPLNVYMDTELLSSVGLARSESKEWTLLAPFYNVAL